MVSPTPGSAQQWREQLTRLRTVDGWHLSTSPRLVPVRGKSPGIAGDGWQRLNLSDQQVLANPDATGFGLITGPQPTGDSVLAVDFDGLAAVQFAFDHGIDPTTTATWTVARTDATGEPVPGRFKLLFRPTPDQAQRLGDACSWSLRLTEPAGPSDAGEGIEVFHHSARQVVLLGAHPSGGNYFWPQGRGPEALATLPHEWFTLALAVAEAREQGRGKLHPEEKTRRDAARRSDSKVWRRMGRKEQCPICGRTAKSGDNHICAWLRDPNQPAVVRCFDGSTFSYTARHGRLKPGQTILGSDGRTYAFTSEGNAEGIGMRGNFREHRPREQTVSLPPAAPMLVDAPPAGPTVQQLIDSLPGGTPPSSGNGNHHQPIDPAPAPAEPPAAQQVIDVVAGPGPLQLPGNITLESMLAAANRLATDCNDGRIDPFADPGRTACLEQLASIAQCCGRLDARAGSTAISAQVKTALRTSSDLVGTSASNPLMLSVQFDQLVKAARTDEQRQLKAQARDLQRTRTQEALLQSTAWGDGPPPAGQEWKPLLAALSVPTGDADLGELMKALEQATIGRPGFLRWNLLLHQTEMTVVDANGTAHQVQLPVPVIDNTYAQLAQVGWKVRKGEARDAVLHTARQNSYHPVREYLHGLLLDQSVNPVDLNTVAAETLGVTDELSATLVRKTLIGAVARALEPGCQMQTVLVLKGEQGDKAEGKSTWIRALLPNLEWLNDTADVNSKDFLLAMHSCWIHELQELEHITNKRAAGELKAQISASIDRVRAPYASAAERLLRPSVMIATVNTDDFLRDNTGARRFWVVDVGDCSGVRPERVRRHRDSIWKAALLAYQQRTGSCDWWLTPDEARQLQELNETYEPESRHGPALLHWAEGLPTGACFTLPNAAVLSGLHRLPTDCKPAEQAEMAKVLKASGAWERKRIRPGNRYTTLVTVWHRTGEEPDNARFQRPDLQQDQRGGPPAGNWW